MRVGGDGSGLPVLEVSRGGSGKDFDVAARVLDPEEKIPELGIQRRVSVLMPHMHAVLLHAACCSGRGEGCLQEERAMERGRVLGHVIRWLFEAQQLVGKLHPSIRNESQPRARVGAG